MLKIKTVQSPQNSMLYEIQHSNFEQSMSNLVTPENVICILGLDNTGKTTLNNNIHEIAKAKNIEVKKFRTFSWPDHLQLPGEYSNYLDRLTPTEYTNIVLSKAKQIKQYKEANPSHLIVLERLTPIEEYVYGYTLRGKNLQKESITTFGDPRIQHRQRLLQKILQNLLINFVITFPNHALYSQTYSERVQPYKCLTKDQYYKQSSIYLHKLTSYNFAKKDVLIYAYNHDYSHINTECLKFVRNLQPSKNKHNNTTNDTITGNTNPN